jgi:nucleoside-diphosphate-sugar epimerase
MEFERVLKKYTDTTVLITGGAGCIGSNLTKTLIEAEPTKITILDDLSSSFRWNVPTDEIVQFVEGSILDEQKMKKVFSESPDYVFHLAAHFANQNSIDHPEDDLMVNGLGHLRVMESCRLANPESIVYASSGCSVYGSDAPLPFREEYVSLKLDTPYQIHKLLGELYCNHYNHIYGLPIAIARYFNVYGPGEVPGRYRNVIPNFIWNAMHNRPLTITGTGEETRDFAFVDDIVDGTLRLGVAEKAKGEVFNLATDTETAIRDLAKMVNDLTGNDAGIVYGSKRNWDKSGRRRASIDKARELIGYNPSTKVKDGIHSVYEWLSQNKERIEDYEG